MRILKTLSLVAAGLATCALLCQPVLGAAVPLNTAESSILPSTVTAGAAVTVNWEVSTTLNPGLYTYEYQVINGAILPTTGAVETGAINLDFLSVTFNAALAGAVVGTGNTSALSTSGASWLFGGLGLFANTPALNTPGVLYFTSALMPILNNADASDEIPPSPFSSGDQVAVPNVIPITTPDGGTTLFLLGFALMGLENLRRRLGK